MKRSRFGVLFDSRHISKKVLLVVARHFLDMFEDVAEPATSFALVLPSSGDGEAAALLLVDVKIGTLNPYVNPDPIPDPPSRVWGKLQPMSPLAKIIADSVHLFATAPV